MAYIYSIQQLLRIMITSEADGGCGDFQFLARRAAMNTWEMIVWNLRGQVSISRPKRTFCGDREKEVKMIERRSLVRVDQYRVSEGQLHHMCRGVPLAGFGCRGIDVCEFRRSKLPVMKYFLDGFPMKYSAGRL